MRNPLARALRAELERTTLAARDTAESAARDVFTQLGVKDAKAPDWLGADDAALRRALRARARALGCERAADGSQKVAALAEEVAYEQWHRMVFARFLAENGLLMYDGVSVTIADCAGLAEEGKLGSAWDVAADCAARMLPGVFRPDSLSFKVKFAPDKVKRLEQLVESLAPETFQASDSLGWLYQFWQTRRKAEVNASEVKIGADELAPVTQLFTEPYMVAFLLDNSLGAWYAAKKLKGRSFASEAEARAAAATPEIPLKYLRLVGEAGGEWRPAAGSFEKWPENLKDFSMLDPCCGSGHFAVATLLMLAPMRMELEGLDARTAVDKVLSENIHALELDRRCVEIAAFAVALEAWRYPGADGYRPLPRLNIACVGIAPSGKRDEWLEIARRAARKQTGDDDKLIVETDDESLFEENLVRSMGALWDCFQQAPILGSLIAPDLFGNDLWHQTDYNTLAEVLAEHLDMTTDDEKEASIAAQGIIQSMQLLGKKYTLVATNVPYLARGRQDELLQRFCLSNYPDSKNDLATVFVQRCLKFIDEYGFLEVVSPENWLYKPAYEKLRYCLLKDLNFNFLIKLSAGAFETISGEVVKVTLVGFDRKLEKDDIWGLDVSEERLDDKITGIRINDVRLTSQRQQLANPGAIISLDNLSSDKTLGDYAVTVEGLSTGDGEQFIRQFWEVFKTKGWVPFVQNVSDTIYWGGRSDFVFWEDGNGKLKHFPSAHNFPSEYMNGQKVLGGTGIRITQMDRTRITMFGGEVFGKSGASFILKCRKDLEPVFCFMENEEFDRKVRSVSSALYKSVGTYLKVPFNLERWQEVAAEKYPNGLPEPFTDDPTQWIFHGHPCGSVVWNEETKKLKVGEDRVEANVLHVAVARLLGYRWPSELDEKMELADEMREVMKRNAAIDKFTDKDGIVSIPALNGEESAASRLMALLAEAYGEAWSAAKLEALLENAGAGGKTLDEWLRKDFFLQHAKLFGSRPFIWQIWDGLRDGFSVLVNYHKLDRKGLETLIYSYLGDWMTRQQYDIAAGVPGAEEKFDRANELKGKLERILEGEAPYDIFVRWKALKDQPVGWNPDLNDGVRLNIRPFFAAGVLREKAQKLNIKWGKDRGKDSPSAPWYAVSDGGRINDHHTTLAEKRAAKGR